MGALEKPHSKLLVQGGEKKKPTKAGHGGALGAKTKNQKACLPLSSARPLLPMPLVPSPPAQTVTFQLSAKRVSE